jgi:hypothetical protein
MIRSALRSIGRRLAKHDVVGADASGNQYLRYDVSEGGLRTSTRQQ